VQLVHGKRTTNAEPSVVPMGSLSRQFWFTGSDGSNLLCLPTGMRPPGTLCSVERYRISHKGDEYKVEDYSALCIS